MNIFRYLVVIFILSYSSIAPAMAQKANVDKLDENVYAINLLGYTSLVVIGDEDVLITDTANTYRANFLKETIAELTDKPVTKIVLSHEHFDHTGGSQVFDGAEVIAQQNALAVINLDPLDSFPDRIDVVFKERLTFDLGTTTVELRHLGAADGVAATIVYLPNEKIALTADTYSQARLTPAAFLTDTNQLGVRKILNELVSLNLKHAVTAHSTSTDPAAVIENAEYFNDLYDLLFQKIVTLRNEDSGNAFSRIQELHKTVKLPKYENWENYDSLSEHARKMVLAIIHGG